jgi:II/X family phage/plasmid replication protein
VFLQALGDRATIRKRGRGHFNSDFCSVGWGFGNDLSNGDKKNGSRRSTLKFYNKFEEIKRHPMTCGRMAQKLLSEWIEGKVRVEACFRGMELKRLGYKLSRDWDEQAPRALLNTFLERLEMPDQVTLLDDTEKEVPRSVRATYDLWASGFDMKGRLPKNTFYRHRRMLLEHGIDISVPKKDVQRPGRTLQLVRILEAKPAEFPHEYLFRDLALDGFERLKEASMKKAA